MYRITIRLTKSRLFLSEVASVERAAAARTADEEVPVRPIRLLLADDHALVLQALRLAFEPYPDLEIVAEAPSGSEGLPRGAETNPDVILLDIRMPGIDRPQLAHHPQQPQPPTNDVVPPAVGAAH